MQKWRYLVVCEAGGLTDKSWRTSDGRTLRTKGNSNAAIDHFGFLNELGEDGWELVAVTGVGCHFKRRVE